MKKYLLKTISALLTGVMLVGMAVPAMADIADIQVIDLASAPMVISAGTPENYPTPTGTDISINIVGAGETESVYTSSLKAGEFAKIKAEETHNDCNFSHYEYVTTARNYIASYDNEFTFYVDPPMTINVVYTDQEVNHSGDIIISGMYKDPKTDGENTYFYCAVAGAKGDSTTADITFGRSQKDESDTVNNSETFKTETAQNIYDSNDTVERGSFQYIVSSAIQTGGPIDFKAKVNGTDSTALIKTWDLHSGAFYGKTNGTVNDLTIDGNKYSFNANIGDKVRVYTTNNSELSVTGLEESKKNSDGKINEYTATAIPVSITGSNIEKIMVNPMDVAIAEDGQPSTPSPDKSTTGTIEVKVISNSTVNKGKLLSGATVEATKGENNVTIPETDEGVYSLSVPDGDYDVKVTLNGIEATGNATVNKGETVNVEIPIKDIREEKIDTLFKEMRSEDYAGDGSKWNKETPNEAKWSYINGCMTTAFMDIYEITDDKALKDELYKITEKFQSTSIKDDGTGEATGSTSISSAALDNVNPGKSILDIIELVRDGKETSSNIDKFNECIKVINGVLQKQSRINAGNFYHKDTYPHQVWLDGTYMALPYMLQYIRLYPEDSIAGKAGKLNVIDDVVNQFKNIETKMKDDTTGLYYHGYDAQADKSGDNAQSKAMSWAKGSTANSSNKGYYVSSFKSSASKDGCSSNYWSRSMGWFAMALIDSYEQIKIMEEKDNTTYSQKDDIARIFRNLMDAVCDYQFELNASGDPTGIKGNGTGLWYQVTDHPEGQTHSDLNYIESSGSATFAAALMKGYNLGIYETKSTGGRTPEDFYNAGLNAFNALTDYKLNETGQLKDICKSAGLGGNSGSGTKKNHTTGKVKNDEEKCILGDAWYEFRDGSLDYYLSEPVVYNDAKGAAPYLMAYAQKLKHDKNLQSANS